MAPHSSSSQTPSPGNSDQTNRAAVIRRPSQRRLLLRRRKAPAIRLGGKRGFSLVRMLRRIRVRWVRLHYASCMLKKLKRFYAQLIRASATFDTSQHRLFMETSFGIPVVSVSSFSTF